jgi:hypothetical protein
MAVFKMRRQARQKDPDFGKIFGLGKRMSGTGPTVARGESTICA